MSRARGDAYFYFLFQGDGNIPHNVNENHRSSVYFIIRGKKKKEEEELNHVTKDVMEYSSH